MNVQAKQLSRRHAMLYQWPVSKLFLVTFSVTAAALLAIAVSLAAIAPQSLALPVHVVVTTDGAAAVSLRSSAREFPPIQPSGRKGRLEWSIQNVWVSDLTLGFSEGTLAKLKAVDITIGDRAFSWKRLDFLARWQRIGNEGDSFEAPWNARAVKLSQVRSTFDEWVRNWPGNWSAISTISRYPLLAALLAALAAVGLAARVNGMAPALFTSVSIGAPSLANPARIGVPDTLWTALGCCLVTLVLELREPLFFMQDDNLAQFGPVIVTACTSLFHGVFPAWNPSQFLGAPTADLGVYALTYPPTYLSCGLAQAIGRPLATIDIFVLAHLFFGAFGVLALCRRLSVRSAIAVLTALAYAFNGYMLVTGRSWFYMAPTAGFLPWLLYFHHRLLRDDRPTASIVGFGLLLGATFHGGNAQMWVYAIILIGVLTLCQLPGSERPWRFLTRLAIAGLGGISLAMPLLVPQLAFLSEVARDVPVGRSIHAFDFIAVLLPYPFNGASSLFGGQGRPISIQAYHMSAPLASFWAIGILALLLVRRHWRGALADGAWGIAALIGLLLAGGPPFGLWAALGMLPGLSEFQHPFKFILLVDGFIAIAGAIAISRWAAASKRKQHAAVAALALAFAWHVGVTHSASHYGYPLPPAYYWETEPSGPVRQAQRIHTIAPERNQSPTYINALPQNWATLRGILSTRGYDPLLEQSQQGLFFEQMMTTIPSEVLRAYGVDRLVIHETSITERYGPSPGFWARETLKPEALLVLDALLADDRIRIMKYGNDLRMAAISNAAPLAFRTDTGAALPLQFDWSGIAVDIRGVPAGTTIIANWMNRRGFQAAIDGQAVGKTEDAWRRLAAIVPPGGGSTLDFRYRAPWGLGLLAGAIGLGLCLAAWAATETSWRPRLGGRRNSDRRSVVS